MATERTSLVLASELPGRPVVAISSGDDLAELKDVIFDAASHRLIGFTLNKRGWFRGSLKTTLPADRIEAIGPSAVMVATDDDLVDADGAPEPLSTTAESVSVIGLRVMSRNGEDLGEIDDVVLETGVDPRAAGYRVAGSGGHVFVPISAQLSLSEDNLLLPAEADAFIRDDLAGFGAAVGTYRAGLDDAGREEARS